MVSGWKTYVLTIIVSTLCTWAISEDDLEKIGCDDLQLGQYPFVIIFFFMSLLEPYEKLLSLGEFVSCGFLDII